jgi:hypothetical protein
MSVNYCTTGNGVANEYCTLFSTVENLNPATGFTPAVIAQMGLLKMTQQEINDVNAVIPHRLWPQFYEKAYVYQVDENGAPVPFKGFTVGDAVQYPGNNSPCKHCTVHTKEAWEAYSNQNLPGAR